METNITVRELDSELEAAYVRLLPEQSESISRGRLNWRFRNNPTPGSVCALARRTDTNMIIGINAFLALPLKLDGQVMTAFQSMDTIVDPAYRGQGLFTRMFKAFYDKSSSGAASVLYGFPGANSAHGLFNKLGWTYFGLVPFLIKPLRTGYFLGRLLGRLGRIFDLPLAFARKVDMTGCIELTTFDARVDRLWQSFSRTISCAVERRHDYLNWRLFQHPEAQHYTVRAVEGSGGELRALIAYTAADKHGGKIGYVMEALALPDANSDLQRLYVLMQNDFIAAKVDAVLAWCLSHSPNAKAYRKAGFWPLPARLRPIPLFLGAKALQANANPKVLQPQSWYISYLDSDTV